MQAPTSKGGRAYVAAKIVSKVPDHHRKRSRDRKPPHHKTSLWLRDQDCARLAAVKLLMEAAVGKEPSTSIIHRVALHHLERQLRRGEIDLDRLAAETEAAR